MQRSRRQGLGIWLLFYQLFGVIGINNIPPATLVFTALQVLIFLRVVPVPWHSPADVCISVDSVWHRRQWTRLIFGALEHGSDWHLYYNMVSFVWKGMSLERRFGSPRFAYLISVFTALCGVTLVALNQVAGELAARSYYHQCAVGFSGVLFALKVLTTHYWPHGSHRVMGMPFDMPIRYLVWVELLLIQVLVPNSSLLGHLAGILVGLAYLHTPVGYLVDSGWKIIKSVAIDGPSGGRNRFYSSTRLGGRNEDRQNFNPDGMTEEEQFEFARQESMRSQYGSRHHPYFEGHSGRGFTPPSQSYRPSAPYPENDMPGRSPSDLPYPETDYIRPTIPTRGLYPDLEEIRRQRLNRFH